MSGDYTVQRLDDAAAFLESTRALRAREPVLTNVLGSVSLAVVAGRRYDGAAWWLVRGAAPDDEVVGAAMLTPPFPLTVSPMPEAAARALGAALRAEAHAGALTVGEVGGPPGAATAVADALGPGAEPVMDELVQVLDVLTPAAGVAGRARAATRDDIDLVRAWLLDFAAEAGLPGAGRRHAGGPPRLRIAAALARRRWHAGLAGRPRTPSGDAHGHRHPHRSGLDAAAAPSPRLCRSGHRPPRGASGLDGRRGHALHRRLQPDQQRGVYARLGFRVVGSWVQLALV